MTKDIHVIGGGTVTHVRPHLAIAAPAYGRTVHDIFSVLWDNGKDPYPGTVHLYTTRMAGNQHEIWNSRVGTEQAEPPNLETNEDIAALLDRLVEDPKPKIIFLPAALVDFEPVCLARNSKVTSTNFGKNHPRLSSEDRFALELGPADKIIRRVRRDRKDIFLVGFKTTTGAAPQEQFEAGLRLVKQASCNLVLANDLTTRLNMIVTPEQAPYAVSADRRSVLRELVKMAIARSEGTFTRSNVVDGDPVPWVSDHVPASLRAVVNHCIARGAYRPFMGSTVGHFAYKTNDGRFVTSRRGGNYNNLSADGMVIVETTGPDRVEARGSKPSVGGQSQRIIFDQHPGYDCIVHFHCPLKPGVTDVSMRPQWAHECGSHECGRNASEGLRGHSTFSGQGSFQVKAVMLDQHGPNVVFAQDMDPEAVINFIESRWDLTRSTSEVEAPA